MVRAIQVKEYCGPDDLKLVDVPVRTPGPTEVRIAVRAAAVNFADSLMISNEYQHKPPLPIIPGMVAKTCIFDGFLLMALWAFRRRREIAGWIRQRWAARVPFEGTHQATEAGQELPAE